MSCILCIVLFIVVLYGTGVTIANNQLEKFRLIFSRYTNRDVAPLIDFGNWKQPLDNKKSTLANIINTLDKRKFE